jgi:hypothetical protein
MNDVVMTALLIVVFVLAGFIVGRWWALLLAPASVIVIGLVGEGDPDTTTLGELILTGIVFLPITLVLVAVGVVARRLMRRSTSASI